MDQLGRVANFKHWRKTKQIVFALVQSSKSAGGGGESSRCYLVEADVAAPQRLPEAGLAAEQPVGPEERRDVPRGGDGAALRQVQVQPCRGDERHCVKFKPGTTGCCEKSPDHQGNTWQRTRCSPVGGGHTTMRQVQP